MKSSASSVAQGGLSVSKTIMKIPFCRNCDPDMKPNPQRETSNFTGDKSQAHLKKIVILLGNGDLSFRCKVLHQPPHIGLLSDVFLGIYFKSTEWVWEHFVPALSEQRDKQNVEQFSESKAPFLFHPESVYLDLRTSLLKIGRMG